MLWGDLCRRTHSCYLSSSVLSSAHTFLLSLWQRIEEDENVFILNCSLEPASKQIKPLSAEIHFESGLPRGNKDKMVRTDLILLRKSKAAMDKQNVPRECFIIV